MVSIQRKAQKMLFTELRKRKLQTRHVSVVANPPQDGYHAWIAVYLDSQTTFYDWRDSRLERAMKAVFGSENGHGTGVGTEDWSFSGPKVKKLFGEK